MAGQIDLFLQPAPEPRCVACEEPLILAHKQEHLEPSYVCCTPRCVAYGKCSTCEMLMAWYAEVDE